MPEFKCAPGCEVLGVPVIAFANAFPSGLEEIGLKILARHGLGDLQPDQWYSYQFYLDAMKDIADAFGRPLLAEIGEAAVRAVELPPEWKTLDALLPAIDAGYQMQHRGDPGHYRAEKIESDRVLNRARVVSNCPHPCEYSRGVLEGLVGRFKIDGAIDILVRHDDEAPCKKDGADSCTYIITWV